MRAITRSGYQRRSLEQWLQEPVCVDWDMPFHDAVTLFFEKEVPILFVQRSEKIVGFARGSMPFSACCGDVSLEAGGDRSLVGQPVPLSGTQRLAICPTSAQR